jgi:hypothetical protein
MELFSLKGTTVLSSDWFIGLTITIRLYDKNSESDFFFLHQNQNIFFSNIGNHNIFLEKKHNPTPFKLNWWNGPLPKLCPTSNQDGHQAKNRKKGMKFKKKSMWTHLENAKFPPTMRTILVFIITYAVSAYKLSTPLRERDSNSQRYS